jgi:uncharacterized protein YjbJ (UPF0337 family)
MISQQELRGGWNQIKGQLKEKWGQLTDSDLTQAEGNVEKLVGVIQQKTGAAHREVETFFDQCVEEGSNMANRVASSAKQYAQQAGDTAQKYAQQAGDVMSQGYDQVASRVQEGYEEAEEMIRSRPAESLSVAFGAGIITGIVVTLLMRSSR